MKPSLAETVVINSAEMIWQLIEIAGFEMSVTYLSVPPHPQASVAAVYR